jgi:transposase
MCATETLDRGELVALIRKLEALVEELTTRVSEQAARIESLEEEKARLVEENTQLRAALENRPALSGPSAPSWVKANRPRTAGTDRKERKKRKENHARRVEAPTEEVVHAVEVCPDCGRKLAGGWEHRRRQVIDLPRQLYVVRDHVVVRRHCGVCGKDYVPKLDLSAEVVGKSRISIRIMALVAFLKTECRMPLSLIQCLVRCVYGLCLSSGEVTGLLRRVADAGREEYEALREELRSSAVVHADETGWREDGINGYLWAFLTKRLQFFVRDQSRGSAVPQSVLTPSFAGILVSDFYSGYSPLSCRKQRCWVHLLRDLKELEEAHPQNSSLARWRAKVRALFDQAVAYQEQQLTLERPIPMRELRNRVKMRDRFERALRTLAKPYLLKPQDPRHVLAARMEKFLFELFVFLEHPEVPPENNLAERSLRPAVIARKVCGGTRSARGSETMAILRSLFGTWSVRGLSSLDACQALLTPTPA